MVTCGKLAARSVGGHAIEKRQRGGQLDDQRPRFPGVPVHVGVAAWVPEVENNLNGTVEFVGMLVQ
ncbi:MAG: hypothetical protein ACR2P2_15475 [Nakamurella sp.]